MYISSPYAYTDNICITNTPEKGNEFWLRIFLEFSEFLKYFKAFEISENTSLWEKKPISSTKTLVP